MIQAFGHEYFPDDQYTKEIIYIQIDDKMRIAYVRKCTKNGGMMWSPISAMVTINGERKYRDSIKFDSNFLREEVLAFLEARSWEKNIQQQCKPALHQKYENAPAPAAQMSFLDECPF